jgi:hypothetical protein
MTGSSPSAPRNSSARAQSIVSAQVRDGGHHLAGQCRRDLGRPHTHDVRLPLRRRVVDPVIEAAALEGVVQLPGAVRRDDHDRRPFRPDRPDLRDRHLEVRKHLEQEGLELVVGPVDLVHQQHRPLPGPGRLEQRPLHQELRSEEIVDGLPG